MRRCLLLLLFASVVPAFGAPPVVSNVRASQRPGTKRVDIYYDLADADGDPQRIVISASSDGGATYTLPCTTLAGAVGEGVAPGEDLHVVWDAGVDWDGNWVQDCCVRVSAYDRDSVPAPQGMVHVPGGAFQMGDGLEDGSLDERPVRNVQVAGFFIDETEVTWALWEEVKWWGNHNGYSISGGEWKGEDHPIENVSWHEAVKWCNARSEREGLSPCYYRDEDHRSVYRDGQCELTNAFVDWDADGYRLPTEAEWEKAARGGRTGRRFPWGDTISHETANYYASPGTYDYDVSPTAGYHPAYGTMPRPFTAPAASFDPNDYGVFDMAGNVAEWCWDRYDGMYYGTPGTLDNPKGPDEGSQRVFRGGGWVDVAAACRVAERRGDEPYHEREACGFRTVRRQ